MKNHRNNPKLNQKYIEISLYTVATVIVIYILSRIADHTGVILTTVGRFLHYIGGILVPLLLGFIIAYLLFPLVRFFRKELKKLPFNRNRSKDPKGQAVAVTYILTAVFLIVMLSIVISALTNELSVISFDSLADALTQFGRSLQNLYSDIERLLAQMNITSEQINDVVQTITESLGSAASSLGTSFLSSIQNVTGIVSNLIFAIILSIYFLLDAENLEVYWDKVLKAITPRRFYDAIHIAIRDADFVFSGYIRGQLIDAVFMAVMISVALSVIGVKFSVMIGILAGIGNLIPYVGPFIAYGLTIIVCLLNMDWQKLIISVIVLLIIQTIDGNVINPRLLSSNTNVHPMLVIVALLFGSAVGGVLGMLLAVPVAALAKIWFDRGIERLVQKREMAIEDKKTEEIN